MNRLFSKFLAPLVYIVMLTVNYLANALPLGGRDTGVISDAYPNLFTPAGYAFSIWGLIYILVGIYVVYQFLHQNDSLIIKINRLFIANSLLNAGWLFAWHYDIIWLSVIIMFGLLTTLIMMADVFRQSILNTKERWLVRLPFSLYFGWITVATIANITILLVSLNWNGLGLSEIFWTVIVLLVGVVIGSWRTLLDRNIPYALVLIWAYGAILSKHLSESSFAGDYPIIIATTVFCMLVFIGSIIYIMLNKKRSKLTT